MSETNRTVQPPITDSRLNFGFRKKRVSAFDVGLTMEMCIFSSAYAKGRFAHDRQTNQNLNETKVLIFTCQ